MLSLILALAAAQAAVPPANGDDPCTSAPDDCVTIADARLDPHDIVVTAARAPQQSDETGQSVTVITRADLETRQTVSIADYLATTPGVTVTRNGGPGSFTAVRLRGAEAEQTLVVIDGVRVNDPSSPGGGFDFGNLLAASVERVEVLRGPDSVPWGSQAIGGVVNIITQAPQTGIQANGRVEYGYANQLYASGGVMGKTGPVSASVTGGYLRTDGISAAADGTERDGYRQAGGSARVQIAVTDNAGIDLRGYYAHSKLALDGYPPPDYAFADDAEYSTAQEIYGYAGVYANLLDGRFANRAAFTIADINRDNFDPTYGTEPSFIGRGRSERYEYQGDLRLIDQVRVVAGVERENSRFFDGATRARTGITSEYGELIVKPVDALTLTGGVRQDDHDSFGSHTSFGADAALALATGTVLRASYGDGFKAPTLYQLFGAYGTPDLQPEIAHGYEVGVEQRFLDGAARAGITWFHRTTRNQIDFDLGTYTYANIARTRAQGVEFALALQPIAGFTVTGNYSFIDARNRTPGATFDNQLARRPRQTVSVSADYRTDFGLSLGGTISHVGDSFDNAGNTVRLDGYVLAAIRAEMTVARHYTLYGRIDNLFDESYRTVAGYGVYPRAAYAGVRVAFD